MVKRSFQPRARCTEKWKRASSRGAEVAKLREDAGAPNDPADSPYLEA
jgi:hypothetical protein